MPWPGDPSSARRSRRGPAGTPGRRLHHRPPGRRARRRRAMRTASPVGTGPPRGAVSAAQPRLTRTRRVGLSTDACDTGRMANRLADETSPYLLQHAHNPVDWYPWGPEALERARAEDRPIFLSIGYAACHWCHVMERESFEDAEIAGLMNEPLRVDQGGSRGAARPRRRLHGRGAGHDRLGRLADERLPHPGPAAVLRRHLLPAGRSARDARLPPRALLPSPMRSLTRRDEVEQQAGAARRPPAGAARRARPARATSSAASSTRPSRGLAASFDAAHGGFGGAPKFPPPMTLEFLLRAWRRTGDERDAADGDAHSRRHGRRRHQRPARRRVRPLQHRCALAGAALREDALRQRPAGPRVPRGPFRATGDDRGTPRVARETLDFMLAELRTDEGGFASALDADTEGVEGRFYAWSCDDFIDVARRCGPGGERAAHRCRALGRHGDGQLGGHQRPPVGPGRGPR